MDSIQDGPRSLLFFPLVFPGNSNLASLNTEQLSDEMVSASKESPSGSCICWGIPFNVDQLAVLSKKPVDVKIDPITAKWLVFMHTSDYVPTQIGSSPLIHFNKGHGRDHELAAYYTIRYADGTEIKEPIHRFYQIGTFQRQWGIPPCYQAVAHQKPHPVRAHHEQMSMDWGRSQTRVDPADFPAFTYWLWAWKNPRPAESITGFSFEPVSGTVVLAAISFGNTETSPFLWQSRRKAVLKLPVGERFDPRIDNYGLLSQIQLDLGQVISAQERWIYPNKDWKNSYNNLLPKILPNEILVEYTAHPQASFHLPGGKGVTVEHLEASLADFIIPINPASQRVQVKVIEKETGKLVAVKLHAHGEWGEYLQPIDRHRSINTAWFEDYGPDFAHENKHYCTYIPGTTYIDLPLGNVYVEVSKGFEIRPVKSIFEITPETREIEIVVEKSLHWRDKGWVTADTHVHFLSPTTALLEGACEGVNVINLLASQWGELMTNVGDYDGTNTWGAKETGGDGEYLVRVGTENRQHALGHISLLGYKGAIIAPMTTGGPDESAIGDPVKILLTEWAKQCKEQEGLVVLPHFPYPHLENAASIIEGVVDAVEMTSWEDHYHGIDPYSLIDWYRYLNCGYLVAAVGGTDKMTAATAVGTVRTYAHINPAEPFTYETWKQAVRSAETFVTYGPLLDFWVEGKPMGSKVNLHKGGGTVDVHWEVASVTLPVSRAELVINGEIQESVAVSPEGGTGHWNVLLPKCSWLALLVRGHHPDKPEMIAAHSSPVMVHVEGSSMISELDAVTLLEQIEGALAYLDFFGTQAAEKVYKRMRLVLTSAHRRMHNRMHEAGILHKHSLASDHHNL